MSRPAKSTPTKLKCVRPPAGWVHASPAFLPLHGGDACSCFLNWSFVAGFFVDRISSHLESSVSALSCSCRRSVCLGFIGVIAWLSGSVLVLPNQVPKSRHRTLSSKKSSLSPRFAPCWFNIAWNVTVRMTNRVNCGWIDRLIFGEGGSSGPVVVAGDPNASRLIRAIGYQDNELQMPPDSKLPDEAIAILNQWVRSGAFWPAGETAAADQAVMTSPAEQIEALRQSHWSFQPIAPIEPPAIESLTPRCRKRV